MIDAQERNNFFIAPITGIYCNRCCMMVLTGRQFGNVRVITLPLIKFGEKEAELIADDFGFILRFSVRYAFAIYMN